ncbi:MAG: hypothetical protein M5U13_01685 [Thermoanaerobaculia bacterium]|nr:hypothetical protein [Thermoanaerobaculia bacterium]
MSAKSAAKSRATRVAKAPADIFIVEVPTGHGIEYQVHPSPAVIRAGAKRIHFRNFCQSEVQLNLSALPVGDKEKDKDKGMTLTIGPGGKQESVALRAARAGIYFFQVTLGPYGVTATGGSSPKVIIDI